MSHEVTISVEPKLTNFVMDLISGLESKFAELPSIRNSVKTCDNEIVLLDKAIWDESPVLREHLLSRVSHKVLNVPKSCVIALIDVHRRGVYPTDFPGLLNLLALASELELRSLTSKCFQELLKTESFLDSDYPSECSAETVMRFFRVLLNSPLRTMDIYEPQLARIARHSGCNRDVLLTAMNSVKQALGKFSNIDLRGMPISFTTLSLPVVIHRRTGKLQTAVIQGTELKSVDILGKRFNLESYDLEDGFYLKYGLYILYRSYLSIFYKNLQDDNQPILILKDCVSLVTRGNFVFAVQKLRQSVTIFLWTDEGKFVRIYETNCTNTTLDFDCEHKVLAIKSDSRLLFFKLEDNNLSLLMVEENAEVSDFIFSGGKMFFVEQDESSTEIKRITTHRIPISNSEKQGSPVDEESRKHNGEFSAIPDKIAASASFENASGNIFLTTGNALKLVQNFPSLSETVTLMTEGELCALSELSMYS